jgi:phage tail sheath protein FI
MPGNPNSPTFPGVYIKEIPSGVRTITGVATSITAFIGSTLRGPDNQPVTINSFSDYVRQFGGLSLDSSLGYAVNDFFLNGGSQAIIVRVVQTVSQAAVAAVAAVAATANTPATPATPAKPALTAAAPAHIDLPTDGAGTKPLTLLAASSGAWGNNLSAVVDYDTKDPTDTNLFNLTILETDPTTKQVVNVEKFLNVSTDDTSSRYVPRVLKQSSQLVRIKRKSDAAATDPDPWDVPGRPTANSTPIKATDKSGVDGRPLTGDMFTDTSMPRRGIFALDNADLFNILCIPPFTDDGDVDVSVMGKAAAYCKGRRAILLIDPPLSWTDPGQVQKNLGALTNAVGSDSETNAAVFFPRLTKVNSLRENQLDTFTPSGSVAGIFARTDAQRGVWKAPAGLDASLVGISALSVLLNDDDNGELNPLGVNCLRTFPASGSVVWGSRTLAGNDRLASEWKYIPVRRTALYIEESLYRGTQWVVFEPNDEPLWAQIRLNVGAFMHSLFRKGAFQGKTPRDAYFVKCDSESTTQNDIDNGIVNIIVGVAPLKPAEFVIISIQQMAGQIQV